MVFIDKFYRLYSPHHHTPSFRSHPDTINLIDERRWDALNHKIMNVREGTDPNDVPTISQTLIRVGDVFVQDDKKYLFMESKDNEKWLGKKRKISNILVGTEPDDASTMEQTLTRQGDVFIQGKDTFEFIEREKNVWNAKKRKIINLKPGSSENDAVSYFQIPEQRVDSWDFKNKTISNVQYGTHDTDCVTKGQVISLNDNDRFDGKCKQIIKVFPGTQLGDVAVFEQLMKKVGDGSFTLNNENITLLQLNNEKNIWDGKNKTISQIQAGVDDYDVCIMKQLRNLKDIFPNLIVADPISGLKTIDGRDYRPYNFVYHDIKGSLEDGKGNKINSYVVQDGNKNVVGLQRGFQPN